MIHSGPSHRCRWWCQRIFEDHVMGDLQRLPVLIRDEAGLNQEAVDESERHRKHDNSQHTCGQTWHHHFHHRSAQVLNITYKDLTAVQRRFILLRVQLRFSFPQFHIFHFIPKFQTRSELLHQDILSVGSCAANTVHLSGCEAGVFRFRSGVNSSTQINTLNSKYTRLTSVICSGATAERPGVFPLI